ncbi:MAG: SGNH/GDSL hydrolase family protein [Blastocatellales bacterium]|nr:SGNH/GDSL hydrolase family protein [Blastocatellales bacterium]
MGKIRHLALMMIVGAATVWAQAPAQQNPDSPEVLRQQLDRANQRLRDWAQLGRYRDDNAKIAAPASGENRVVFLGDSITDGWKLPEYFPGKPYINRGISGQTTPQMLVRLRPDVIAHKPKVVVILAGTNDIAGNTGPMTMESIQDNYASIAELLRAHGIRVVFASVLPIHDYGPNKVSERRAPEKIRALNDFLKRYCAEQKHIYLDYYTRMLDDNGMLRAELARDGLHPNADGYKIMAPLAEAAIGEALKKR